MYEFTGNIHSIGPVQTKGTFTFREVVVQRSRTHQNKTYYDNACFKFAGDKATGLEYFAVGEEVKVSFNVRSNEWQGRWFTELSAWKIENTQAKPVPSPTPQNAPATAPAPAPADEDFSDLPF
jgi:hypothetical protein